MFTSALNPNVVKTALDSVFKQNWEYEKQPGLATAETAAVFKQETADSSDVILEIFKGSSYWGQKAELADVQNSTPRVGNNKTFTVTEYADSIDISKNLFDDNKHGVYEKMVAEFAEMGRITRDKNAFAVYRNAFTTALTADGVALVSDSHTTLSGNTVDNKLTAALSVTSLNDAIVALGEQIGQNGAIRGAQPSVLLVPLKLFKRAKEITESSKMADTANNNMNIYSDTYMLTVYTSPFLGAAAGGSDTAWFLLGRNHSVTRWVRQGITTDMVDYKYQRNNNYIYKASFREVVGAIDYCGVVGSLGTA